MAFLLPTCAEVKTSMNVTTMALMTENRTRDKLSSKNLRVEFTIRAAESAVNPESLRVETPWFSISLPKHRTK